LRLEPGVQAIREGSQRSIKYSESNQQNRKVRREQLLNQARRAGNSAQNEGGALRLTFSAGLEAASPLLVRFDGNAAEYGGGIFAYLAYIYLTGGAFRFAGNSALSGGAIFAWSAALALVGNASVPRDPRRPDSDVEFWGNSAGFGGALTLLGCSAELDAAELAGNAANYGGAINCERGTSLTLGDGTSFSGGCAKGILKGFCARSHCTRLRSRQQRHLIRASAPCAAPPRLLLRERGEGVEGGGGGGGERENER
jgi:hypothetical protein